ncbi:MAG TPA: hypothetical protein VMU29_12160 [Smithella sp.]|nr:hypothetical protein [Smithella sp.]
MEKEQPLQALNQLLGEFLEATDRLAKLHRININTKLPSSVTDELSRLCEAIRAFNSSEKVYEFLHAEQLKEWKRIEDDHFRIKNYSTISDIHLEPTPGIFPPKPVEYPYTQQSPGVFQQNSEGVNSEVKEYLRNSSPTFEIKIHNTFQILDEGKLIK